MEFWVQLQAVLESGQSAQLTIVAHNTRHSPGTRGARMFVSSAGEVHGTIGGGGMERELIQKAKRNLHTGESFSPRVETLVHRKDTPQTQSGLICAGEQTHVEVLLTPADAWVVDDVVELIANDRPGVLWIAPDGIGIDPKSPTPGQPPVGFEQSAESFRFEEQILNWKRVAILGGGHCGLALSRTLRQLGYIVSVYDTRPDCRTFRENDFARYLEVVEDYQVVGGRIRYPELTHVVIMTTDFPSDVRGLLGISNSGPFPYVGLMGSPTKLRKIAKELLTAGVSKAFVDSLSAPIGLPIKSDKPEEIAISVAAELLSLREQLFPHTAWS